MPRIILYNYISSNQEYILVGRNNTEGSYKYASRNMTLLISTPLL